MSILLYRGTGFVYPASFFLSIYFLINVPVSVRESSTNHCLLSLGFFLAYFLIGDPLSLLQGHWWLTFCILKDNLAL